MAGVILVMISVAASIGLFGFCQVPATLIIFEILPFLVLAVGVDNIFIMVDGFQKSIKVGFFLYFTSNKWSVQQIIVQIQGSPRPTVKYSLPQTGWEIWWN